ncbi:hypothetical protein BGW80DRAFT_621862 [Lactifluus volemus]|nr:hypothetical protein BGW80DRAFT_621862 [Lactifluus volemus]
MAPSAFHTSLHCLGAYTISIRTPFSYSDPDVALSHILVYLHSPPGALKFSASLRAKYVAPFRTLTVFAVLATHPFILFLTLPRILRQAAVLHFPGRRQLNVYKWLEPKPVSWSTPRLTAQLSRKVGELADNNLRYSSALRAIPSSLS